MATGLIDVLTPPRSGAAARMPWEAAAPTPPAPLARLATDILTRCRGEGPANCVGQCPLHVDARGYVQLAKQGKYREALQLVRDKLPFPGILGFACAHPCEQHCKRVDDDTPVRIRDIKRFLAMWEPGPPQHVLTSDPPRPERVAIVGSGPAGLLAAHDLRRRGYQVTLFERGDRIGGCLTTRIPDFRIPAAVVARDLSIVDALGIEVRTRTDVGVTMALDALRDQFDAVVLALGYEGAARLLSGPAPMEAGIRDTIAVDPVTGQTKVPKVFAAGDGVSGPSTIIHSLAQGRRAAESVHRFLTGADQAADREGPSPARLLWRLDVDDLERKRRVRTPVMLQPHNEAMTEADVKTESARCLDCQCGLCVNDCEFLAKHCRSPKDLARRVMAGLDPLDTRSVVYSCNICELCGTVCPEKLDTGHMLLEARREAVRRGIGPLKQHKPIIGYWKAGVSKPFTLVMPEPGRRKSKRLFFTGCSLPATAPENTLRIYDELRRHYPGTGVLMWCCGAPAELLGMQDGFDATSKQIADAMDAVGAEELVASCPDCMHTMKTGVPGLQVTSLWERLAGVWHPPAARNGVVVSIHDSCKSRHEPGLCGSIRQILGEGGAVVQDVDYSFGKSRCCGFGGMIYPVDPELSQRVTKRRASESPMPMITYCAGCRTALASCGKESLHILDFLYKDDWRTRAQRPSPGSIPRYLNRLRTKWAFKRLRPLGGGAE